MENKYKIALGFSIGFILLFLLIFGVGWNNLINTLVGLNPYWIAFSITASLLAIFFWAMCWKSIINASGSHIRVRDIFPIFLSGVFANNITPLGQAGGEAAIAYILSSKTDINYEKSFATILVTDILNLLPFLLFSFLGLMLLAIRVQMSGNTLYISLGGVMASSLILVLFYLLLTKKDLVEKVLLYITTKISTGLDFLSQKWTRRFSRENVKEKIEGFYECFDLMKEDKRNLGKAFVFSIIGWLAMVLSIQFIFVSLGLQISIIMGFFVVALTSFVSFTPLPGGTGGVEIAITIFLSSLIGLSLGSSSSVAILYRFVTYWIPLVIGGLVSLRLIRTGKISASLNK